MSVEYKDYYKILGVSRTAGDDEVRKAFRALARKYHPDVAKDKKGAEDKFKEINEAYEVLGDDAKRKKYDALGENWNQGTDFRPPPGWQQRYGGSRRTSPGKGGEADADFHFGGTGFSDFFESVFGRRGANGFGRRGGFATQDVEEDYAMRGRDVEAEIMVTLEEALRGSMRAITLRHGDSGKTETYKVRIPPGVREGQRLRLGSRGERGAGGGPAGDLYLRVKFAQHPDYRLEGNDVFYELELAPWEAVLGTSVSVPTLDGHVNLKIPAGTQSGRKLRLREKGLPQPEGARGNFYVVVRVQVPAQMGERERALWEQLKKESHFHPRE